METQESKEYRQKAARQELRQELLQTVRDLDGYYQDIRPLTEGGVGRIYAAHKPGLDVDVVIKKVKGKYRGRLNERSEADILKNLKHKYLPAIYDIIEKESGYVYTVMEYVEGDTLQKRIRERGAVSQQQAYRWMTQLCEVVAYLHEQTPPIVHCDIKPSNIIITPKDEICLIDFNTSLIFDGEKKAIGATAGYAAPEQYNKNSVSLSYSGNISSMTDSSGSEDSSFSVGTGKETGSHRSAVENLKTGNSTTSSGIAKTGSGVSSFGTARTGRAGTFGPITPRTDVYSIGATAYYMLTGSRPKHALEQAVLLSDFNLPLTKAFVSLVQKAMEKQPADRFEDARALYKAVLNVDKADDRYKKLKRAVIAFIAGDLLLAGIGAASLGYGIHKTGIENNARYAYLLEEADHAADESDYETAEDDLAEAEELLPDRADAYVYEADLSYRQGDYDTCINQVQYVMDRGFDDTEDHMMAEACALAGSSYYEQEDYKDAVAWYQKALGYDGSRISYYRDCAVSLAQTGDIEGARNTTDSMLANVEGAADSLDYCMVDAELKYQEKNYSEALTSLEKIVQESDDPVLVSRAAIVAASVGKDAPEEYGKSAAELIETAMDKAGDAYINILRSHLAQVYAAMSGSTEDKFDAVEYAEKAIDCYQDMIDADHGNYSVRINQAILLTSILQTDEAEEKFLSLTEDYPDRYEAYKWLAIIYVNWPDKDSAGENDYTKAINYFDQGYELYQQAVAAGGAEDAEMIDLKNQIDDLR